MSQDLFNKLILVHAEYTHYFNLHIDFVDKFITFLLNKRPPGPPLTYFNDGGGGPSDFFGSEILAQSDFFGSMKHAKIFWGHEKNRGIFWGCKTRTKGFFLGMPKKCSDFFGYKI